MQAQKTQPAKGKKVAGEKKVKICLFSEKNWEKGQNWWFSRWFFWKKEEIEEVSLKNGEKKQSSTLYKLQNMVRLGSLVRFFFGK